MVHCTSTRNTLLCRYCPCRLAATPHSHTGPPILDASFDEAYVSDSGTDSQSFLAYRTLSLTICRPRHSCGFSLCTTFFVPSLAALGFFSDASRIILCLSIHSESAITASFSTRGYFISWTLSSLQRSPIRNTSLHLALIPRHPPSAADTITHLMAVRSY
ncbi:hypothetical protein LZ30DRAFT_182378 [Colletotrichum cereale]|nr:hypothetical protein LZ30DRAFT_182378 [Colletotrichum cereale]